MILFTSENNTKTSLFYGIMTVFTALLGFIYELFSHQVYSNYMIYAFAIPLMAGLLPSLLISAGIRLPFSSCLELGSISGQLYSGAIMIMTMGSIIKGVLDIYGTTNSKIIIYPVLGMIMILISIIAQKIFRPRSEI